MSEPDLCAHGVDGWCRTCCAAHEGKLAAEDSIRIDDGETPTSDGAPG